VAAYEKSKLLELEMAHVKRSPRHKETTIRPITTLSDALLCSEPISAENSAKLNSKDICELTLNYCELFPCSCEPPTLPITPPLESGEENAQMAVQNGRVDNEEIVWKLLQNVNDNKLVIM
jgi:hypothetical protein